METVSRGTISVVELPQKIREKQMMLLNYFGLSHPQVQLFSFQSGTFTKAAGSL
jgi:hypothetical protein